MQHANHGACACSAIHHDNGDARVRAAVDWLGLAATPVFAFMALLAYVPGGGAADLICSAAHGGSSLGGMVPMYLLMATFHSAPWLKLASSRRRSVRPRENIIALGDDPGEEDSSPVQSNRFTRRIADGAARTIR